MFDIQEELKKLPAKPGVYLMHNSKDEIIYVGKAIKLCNRVRQYFQDSRNLSVKIQHMVKNVAYFEYIITDSELEALVLENNLIKEHHPKYNTKLKDDKGYPYIKVTVNEEFPRIMLARKMKADGGKYFGPYTSAGAVNDTIELLRKIFKIRTCNRRLPKDTGKDRPCLYYQIKQCDAPCQGYISKEEYAKQIEETIKFLNGNYKQVAKMLQGKMQKASDELEFEQAMEYRDLLKSIERIMDRQKINTYAFEDRDIIAMAQDDKDVVVSIFFIRQGKLLGREHFHMEADEESSKEEVLGAFVKQFYAGTPYLPGEIFLEHDISEKEIIEEWLSKKRGAKVHFKIPVRGQKHKMVEMAKENARRNGLTDRMDFLVADVFDLLPELAAKGKAPYDFIILDPPAFTKSRKTVDSAQRGYKEINMRALRLLPRGGYFATASCSHFMPSEQFVRMLRSAALDAGVELRQIEARQQAPDHPILWNVPETDYLKFYLFQVV